MRAQVTIEVDIPENGATIMDVAVSILAKVETTVIWEAGREPPLPQLGINGSPTIVSTRLVK